MFDATERWGPSAHTGDSMALDFTEWGVLLAWIVFVFWQWTSSARERSWYDSNRGSVRCAPPGWVYGIVWVVLYAFIVVVGFVYSRDFQAATVYDATLWILFANVLLNKLWSLLFFEYGSAGWAFLAILLLVLSEIAVLVLLVISAAWLPFGLWVPYLLWSVVAMYLNYQWWSKALPTGAGSGEGKKEPTAGPIGGRAVGIRKHSSYTIGNAPAAKHDPRRHNRSFPNRARSKFYAGNSNNV